MPNTSGLRRGGSPGRPRGVPNRATKEARAFLQSVLSEAFADPQFRENLVRAITQLQLDSKVLRLVFEYAIGRPALNVDMTLRGATLEQIVAGTVVTELEEEPEELEDPDTDGPDSPTTH